MSTRSPHQFSRSVSHMSPPPNSSGSVYGMDSPSKPGSRMSNYGQQVGFRSPPPLLGRSARRETSVMRSPASRVASLENYGEAAFGDTVEVPGNHLGTVMYVGPVQGREGLFLGVDLSVQDSDKGRNNGSHNGTQYFAAKGPSSGIFVPQGRCRVIESHAQKDRPIEQVRPSSRQIHLRPGSRMRSFSGRSFSGISTPGSPRPLSDTLPKPERPDPEAAALQKLLNENAMLNKELEESQNRLIQLQRTNAIQAQEMEELMTTLGELEALQNGSRETDSSPRSMEMQAFIEDRERKIEELRNEAEVRRTEFRQVTEHQQATIDELKSLHEAQLTALQEKHDDIEERLLSSAGDQFNQQGQDAAQMEVLQGQLLELSDELDALVSQQDRARQDIEIANSRIEELEAENNRLLEELSLAHKRNETPGPRQKMRHSSSIEDLPDSHPQKKQTIDFLKNELRTLQQEKDEALSKLSEQSNDSVPETVLDEMVALKRTIAELQQTVRASEDYQTTVRKLQTELEDERAARDSLENQHRQMEDTLERTILHINSKSPRNSLQNKPSRSLSKPAPISIPSSPVERRLDLRSPRPDRGQITADLPSEGVLFCEFCETEGHDIVSCSQVFGSNNGTPAKTGPSKDNGRIQQDDDETY